MQLPAFFNHSYLTLVATEGVSVIWDLRDGCTVPYPTESGRQFLPEAASSRMHHLISTESLCRGERWQVPSTQCRKLPADPTSAGIIGDMVLQV